MTESKKTTQKPTPEQATAVNTMSDQDIIAQLMAEVPANDAVTVDLPSKNKFYKLADPSKPITLRPMTFDDEKAMLSNKNPNIDVINILLTRCIENISIGHLLQMDKLYLIMKLREISYGDEYSANISCPSCRKDNKITFEMSKLGTNYADDNLTDPVSIDLPVMKQTVKVRLPRVEDEHYFVNSDVASGNLWRFVESIGNVDSKKIISQVIKQLPLRDAHALMKGLSTEEYGLDTKVRFVCSYCAHHEVMELPITSDFFTGN